MQTSRSVFVGGLVLAATLAASGWGETTTSAPPNPASSIPVDSMTGAPGSPQVGAVNYVEGQAAIDGRALSPKSIGSLTLEKGQSLTTAPGGRVELLLTPGVFLRVDDNSSVQMVSPRLVPTVVDLTKGRAIVEVTYITKNNDIRVNERDANTQLLKKGLYDFDADTGRIRVFKGQAVTYVDNRKITVFQDDQVDLNGTSKPKVRDFKTAEYQDDFYRWCGLRSGEVLQANAYLASEYGAYPPGWDWDPWFDGWAFPFDWGYGFYSPFWGWGAPFYGGFGYGYGGYGYGGYGYRGFGPGRFGVYGGRGFGGGGFHGGFGGGFGGGGGRR